MRLPIGIQHGGAKAKQREAEELKLYLAVDDVALVTLLQNGCPYLNETLKMSIPRKWTMSSQFGLGLNTTVTTFAMVE